jgi:hypothetical protein
MARCFSTNLGAQVRETVTEVIRQNCLPISKLGILKSGRDHGIRCMKKVAVFGGPGGGKSTLAKTLAELTRLPLYPLDLIEYRAGVGKVPHEEYLKAHADLLKQDQWVIDGFGCVPSAWERFAAADTLVYIDLPLFTHYRWITKRLVGSVLNSVCEASKLWKHLTPAVA